MFSVIKGRRAAQQTAQVPNESETLINEGGMKWFRFNILINRMDLIDCWWLTRTCSRKNSFSSSVWRVSVSSDRWPHHFIITVWTDVIDCSDRCCCSFSSHLCSTTSINFSPSISKALFITTPWETQNEEDSIRWKLHINNYSVIMTHHINMWWWSTWLL